MMGKPWVLGHPYVMKCPVCGSLTIVHIIFGSGAYICDNCFRSTGLWEVLRMDYISEEEIERNNKEYKDYLLSQGYEEET